MAAYPLQASICRSTPCQGLPARQKPPGSVLSLDMVLRLFRLSHSDTLNVYIAITVREAKTPDAFAFREISQHSCANNVSRGQCLEQPTPSFSLTTLLKETAVAAQRVASPGAPGPMGRWGGPGSVWCRYVSGRSEVEISVLAY